MVVIKPRYKIILVCAGMWAKEHRMHRQVTRLTLFFYYKGSGTETTGGGGGGGGFQPGRDTGR